MENGYVVKQHWSAYQPIHNAPTGNLSYITLFILPYFIFSTETATYSEKDRIIENSVYEVSFEIKLQENEKLKIIILYRYLEAMQKMIEETDSCFIYHFAQSFRTGFWSKSSATSSLQRGHFFC